MRIVLDAMGGDYGPEVTVAGAVDAAREFGLPLVLVGQQARVQQELAQHDRAGLDIAVVDAAEQITMDDRPGEVVRSKPNSSMHVGMRLVKQGEADAFVTMGNTGGALAVALFELGRIKLDGQRRIHRPALATRFPTKSGSCLLLDIGANTDWRPIFLQQFAVMGSVYVESVLGVANPRLGIVSIGEEEGKGNVQVKEAYDLIKTTPGLNFVGNLEGKDITGGLADVVVTDGFTGNVIVKLSEGVASLITQELRQELVRTVRTKLGAALAKPAFRALGKKLDYAEYGGAVLLGLNHICIIGHGRSNARAVRSAVKVASEAVQADVPGKIRAGLARQPALFDSSE